MAAYSILEPVLFLALFISMVVISLMSYSRSHDRLPATEVGSDFEWGILPQMTGGPQKETNQANIHVTQTETP